jgi:hypothetical protein
MATAPTTGLRDPATDLEGECSSPAIGSGFWDTGDLSISWGSASINGDLALISFDEHDTVVRHTSMAVPPATLESAWHVEMTLIRQDGRWRVDEYLSECNSSCP